MTTQTTTSEGTSPSRKTALIVEGGAMRGAWAAGVLSSLHERGEKNFDLVYAASSGACSAAYFVAGMVERGVNIWHEQLSGRKLVRRSNFILRRKPVIDLAYLVDYVFKQGVPLNVTAIANAPTRFHIVLTDCDTGQPEYFHAKDENIFDALRASASMPFATLGFWSVNGKPYTDGGIADPIPVQRAIADGANDITVVLTHRASFRLTPRSRWVGRLAFPLYPAAAQAWTMQHVRFNQSMNIITSKQDGIRIRVFYPMKPMPVHAFSRNQSHLKRAVEEGRAEALRQSG